MRIPDHAEEIHGVQFAHATSILNVQIGAPDWTQHSPGLPNLKPIADYLRGLFPRRGATKRSRRPGIPPRVIVGLPNLPELIPVAPLRSKPKRTYDPIREHGNLLDAPRGYRDLFVKEIDKLLGFAD